jgi:uncharacterized protein (DUF58 family)
VGFGALNTGNNLLYLLLGLMLAMIVMSGVLSERTLGGLEVRRLGTEAAFAGEPFAFRWALARKRKGISFGLVVTEEGRELQGEGRLGSLRFGEEVPVRGDLVVERRGPHWLSAVKVTTSWPLGLFAKTAVFPLEGLLLAYPRRGYACGDPAGAQPGPVGEAGNPRRNDGNGDVLGLRELEEGEDARRIHWVKSAAVGRLLRTEREREERSSYVLRLPSADGSEAFERRCEEVAALSQRLLGAGHEVGLDGDGKRLRPAAGPGQLRRILLALAWMGYSEEAP